jgi:mannose-6-phosphate isomerase-like protein (cupin superfamily)
MTLSMTRTFQEAERLIRSIAENVATLKGAKVSVPDNPKVQNFLNFEVPDEWVVVRSPYGKYWGRMKRVSNGSGDYLVTLTEYLEDDVMESEWHLHEHVETLQILTGMIEVTMGEVNGLKLYPGDFWRIPAKAPHQINVHPGTRMVLTWYKE